MVARIARVEAVVCELPRHEAAWLERNLLGSASRRGTAARAARRPRSGSGSARPPRTPGLTVVRQPAPGDFGPYLGGQKVTRRRVRAAAGCCRSAHAADRPGRDRTRHGPGCAAPRPGPGRAARASPRCCGDRARWPARRGPRRMPPAALASSSPGTRPSARLDHRRSHPGPGTPVGADGVLVCFSPRAGFRCGALLRGRAARCSGGSDAVLAQWTPAPAAGAELAVAVAGRSSPLAAQRPLGHAGWLHRHVPGVPSAPAELRVS